MLINTRDSRESGREGEKAQSSLIAGERTLARTSEKGQIQGLP